MLKKFKQKIKRKAYAEVLKLIDAEIANLEELYESYEENNPSYTYFQSRLSEARLLKRAIKLAGHINCDI